MKKIVIRSSLLFVLSATALSLAQDSQAANWASWTNWFKKDEKSPTIDSSQKSPQVIVGVQENTIQSPPQWMPDKTTLPQALADIPYLHHVFLPNLIKHSPGEKSQILNFSLDDNHPDWLRISADGQYLEGNEKSVRETQDEIEIGIQVSHLHGKQKPSRQIFKISIDQQGPQPHWGIINLPTVAIRQKNYSDINLNDFVTTNIHSDKFIFTLTPGKANPDWINLQADGKLHINTTKISPEDINTTQILAITATSRLSERSTPTEMTLKIIPNLQLTSPNWKKGFQLTDAIPGQAYHLNLASAVNINELPENDQLFFQVLKTHADWLQIGENGYSLIAKNIPADAADKYFDVSMRVTSRMSEKSQDFNGRIYVNPVPLALQWHEVPSATINQNYTLDLSKYITSNIRNDQFEFQIDLASLPHWLSLQNHQILTGTPQEAALLKQPQKMTVDVKSKISGMANKISFTIPIQTDTHLAPAWKSHFLPTPIVGEVFRSDDLSSVLENRYPYDDYSFEYVNGPSWLNYNDMCHCLASTGKVPADAAGKSFSVQLRVHSQASAKTIDYQQDLKGFTGLPQWTQTQLPDIKIAQSLSWELVLNHYAKDDISGDQFMYALDRMHSPKWLNLDERNGQAYLKANPEDISSEEVGSTQTARILATSQSTKKTSVQLLSIRVLANQELPHPAWANQALPVLNAGFYHAMDLSQYIKGSTANDRLRISLSPENPSWLSIKNNRLVGIPSREQVGVLPPLNFIVHSSATDKDTLIQAPLAVQLVVVQKDNMETHSFYENHQSIVIRGLKKNTKYKLAEVKGSHFDYGPFYSPRAIKTDEDWNANPFYAVSDDKTIETGDDGVVSIVYYTRPGNPLPQFQSIILN